MILLRIYPNPQPPSPASKSPISLAGGGTMSLAIPTSALADAANPYPGLVPMVIDASDPNPIHQSAYYIGRPGLDFPTLGSYSLQAKFSAEGGILLITQPFIFTVADLSNQTTTLVVPFQRQRSGWPWGFCRWPRPWG